jgi:CubicO group peptidase (beta-lactamase class C family)
MNKVCYDFTTIDHLIENDFNGCISVMRGNSTVYRRVYGYSNLADKTPNTPDTKFATASAGKVFVAVAVLQLIEKGQLKFDDTLGELVDFDLHKIDPDITVEQLLTHTSGIPDYFDESVMDDYDELWKEYPNYKIRTSEDLLPLFIDKPMMYSRGERFQYNNTGYVMLGLIIEAKTKKSFDRFLKENLFDISGMHSTGYYELDRLPANCAHNYIYDTSRAEYYTNIYSVDVKGTGAGGAFTTVGDIELFWRALLSNRLLSADMTQKMLSIHSSGEDDNYGYGIWLNKNSETNCMPYFMGSDPGVSFISTFNLEREICITIASNFGNNVWKMLDKIQKKVLSD